jgi:hypothetical protein
VVDRTDNGGWWTRTFSDGTAIRYRISASNATRNHPDGDSDQHVAGTEPDAGTDAGTDPDLRDAADPEAAGCMPDLDAARDRLYTAKAAPAVTNANGRLSRLARRALRRSWRTGAVVSDTYAGWEYDGWID